MWSFATHAGAGMAIAGLTATYYALSRRNYQGERERLAHESGFGDGTQIKRLRKHEDESQSLSQSQLLLRKELQELSVSNGSVSGLNVLYQQKNPLHPFTRSNFEITPIVSRVDNRPSTSSIYSENELSEGDISAHSIIDGGDDTGGGGDNESVFGSKPDLEKNGEGGGGAKDATSGSDQLSELEAVPISSESTSPTKSDERNVDDMEDISKKGTMQPIKDDTTAKVTAEEIVDQINVSVKSSEAKQIETETVDSVKLNPVQETQLLQRTPSPICFFKNPGFGNRYSANMRQKKAELGPLVAATFSSSKINLSKSTQDKKGPSPASEKVVKNDTQEDAPFPNEPVLSSPSKAKDSTQFLLSPVLSQSNVSVCEQDLPEKMVNKRKKRQPFSHSRTDANTKVVIDTNPVEEITKYNKTLKRSKVHTSPNAGKAESVMEEPIVRLRSDPAKSNLCKLSKRSGKPVIVPPTAPPESSGDYAPPPKVKPPEILDTPEKLDNEKVDPPEKLDKNEKVDPPKKVESTKKRVTFKEIQVEEKEFIKSDEEEIIEHFGLDCNNNTNSKETFVTEKDLFNETSVGDGGALLEEPIIQPSDKQNDCSGMLTRPASSSSIGNIPSNSWIAFPVRICTDLMRTVTIPWPLIGLCMLVVMIAGFLGIFLNRLAAVVDRKHREVQLD